MAELLDDLRATALELRETHISWVLMFAERVLKLKKPVNFGFLDFSTLAARRAACEAEVRLNAALAPGVYLGVVPITRDASGRHTLNGAGEVVEFAVEMRRLSDAHRADVLLAEGRLPWAQLEALAAALARFHARCATSPAIAEYGRVEAIAHNVEENFAQAQSALARLAPPEREREVEEWQLGFLRERRALLEERRRRGRVRDGHGDLRLEHVYFVPGEPAPLVLDCIEFNERFRYADVCADIAFLSMDLAWHGRALDKERFLAAYARASDDYDLYGLVDFYESYRAYVRAKVAALGLATQSLDFAARERLAREARGYLLLSVASERPSLVPAKLVAVGGIIASGKSSVADALGYELGLPVVSSDRTRKALLGVDPTEHVAGEAAARAYDAAFTERVYAEVLRRAQVVLASGRSVIVDATFRSRAARAAVRAVASAAGVPFVFVECRASDAVSRARLAAREGVASVSDARLDLYDDFVARYEPVTELSSSEHVAIDTSGTLAQSLAAVQSSGLLPDVRR